MADIDRHVVTEAIVVEQQVSFTLSGLCRACDADEGQLHALVGEGLLQPTGQRPEDWQFDGDALPRTRTALRLSRDLELEPAAVVIVMDLLAEIERLRAMLRRG